MDQMRKKIRRCHAGTTVSKIFFWIFFFMRSVVIMNKRSSLTILEFFSNQCTRKIHHYTVRRYHNSDTRNLIFASTKKPWATQPEPTAVPRTTMSSMTPSRRRKSLSSIPSVAYLWMESKRRTLVTPEPPWQWPPLHTQSGLSTWGSIPCLPSGPTAIVSSCPWDTQVCWFTRLCTWLVWRR